AGNGVRVEIGAGACPMRDSFPDVITTDIIPAPHLDRTLNAEAMDLPDQSVRVIYGQHAFHHLPDPEKFFRELRRVLNPGGGAILIEPYWSPIATFMFKRLFAEEHFDTRSASWRTETCGAMTGANQALSYIVFKRDRDRYRKMYPDLPL